MSDPERLVWTITGLPGRVQAPPLPLDLDGNGKPDHVLAASLGSQVVLAGAGGQEIGRLDLPGPVRHPLAPLSRAAVDGVQEVLALCDTGHAVKLRVSGSGVEVAQILDLYRSPTTGHPPGDLYRERRGLRLKGSVRSQRC